MRFDSFCEQRLSLCSFCCDRMYTIRCANTIPIAQLMHSQTSNDHKRKIQSLHSNISHFWQGNTSLLAWTVSGPFDENWGVWLWLCSVVWPCKESSTASYQPKCLLVNMCCQSTERICHGKFPWGRKYILALEDKMIVKRCIDEGEWEDFFAEFETSMIPGEEEEKEGRGVGGREEMRVGRGGGLEEKTGEIKNMDNLLAPLWTNLFWSLTFKVAWGSFSATRRVDRCPSLYSNSKLQTMDKFLDDLSFIFGFLYW